MIMSKNEKDRVWKELVKSSNEKMGVVRKEKVVRRKEKVVGVGIGRSFLSDLKLLGIMLVVWIGFFVVVEITGAGGW